MCRSKAEGGTRCFPHAAKAVDKARVALWAAQETGDPEARADAASAYEEICRVFAEVRATRAHPSGAEVLATRLRELQAGADPSGDEGEVLDRVVGDAVREQQAREAETARLAALMRSTSPMPSTPTQPASARRVARSGDPNRYPGESVLDWSLRTGVKHSTSSQAPDPMRPVQRGQHWYAGGQDHRLSPWPGEPVSIRVFRDQTYNDGRPPARWDPATQTLVPLGDSGIIDGQEGAVVTVRRLRDDSETPETRVMRAFARHVGTNTQHELVWVLHHDLD